MDRRKTILVAARDDTLAYRLEDALGDEQFCCLPSAADGEGAVCAARRYCPDVLVLDCILPQLDGPAVLDRLRELAGVQMPRVIGGAMLPFAERSLRRRGAEAILRVPWRLGELCAAIRALAARKAPEMDWAEMQGCEAAAGRLLLDMGMQAHLRGFAYLSCAAALACFDEERLFSLGEEIYASVAERFDTTPQSVERLIRHAVERSMDAAHAGGMYRFFGNTIDPTRGKPTNAQAIGMLAEHLRTQGMGK